MSDELRGAPPRDGLVRAQPGMELRAEPGDDGRIGTLSGHFSVFDAWYEVDSVFEGHFMERVAPGAFTDTFARDRDRMRVTFNHGTDPQLGDKVLGPIETLEEDRKGARYVVPLLDTSYNRDLLPGLKAGVYGSSFRFNVEEEVFDRAPDPSKHNPAGIPERTITRARVHEFGPVTFPASPSATAGARSLTDSFRPAPMPAPIDPAPARKETIVEETAVATSDPIDEYRDVAEMAAAREVRRNRLAEIDAEAGSRELTADQTVEWERVNAEITKLTNRIEATEQRRARLAELAAQPANQVPVGSPEAPAVRFTPPAVQRSYEARTVSEIRALSRTDEEYRGLLRDHAMRRIERIQNSKARKDDLVHVLDTKDTEDRELARRIITTDDPAYVRAWRKYIRTGRTDSFTAEERAAALAVGVDATGGYAVPVAFDPTVIAIGAWTATNPYRASCRVETIVGTDTWQALTATAITAAYATEAAAATEQGPTFARPSYIAKRAHAFVTVSYEMAQDRPDIAAELTTLFSEAKDTLEENQFTVGVGTTVYPEGIGLKDAFTRVDSVTNDTVAVADVRAVEAGLPVRHRLNAAWYLSRAAIRAIQAFETTGGQLFNGVNYPAVGNPVAARSGNTGLTLLGYPIWETPSMPWTPTTDDTTWGVLMDPRNYVILDRVGMSVKVIPDMLDGATPSFPTGEQGVYAFWRNTARVLNADGGRQGAVQ